MGLPAVILALLGLAALAQPVLAAEVRFPLTLDYELLRGALRRHLAAQPGSGLELWRTADGCGSLVLRDPVVEPAEGRLRIAGPATAQGGVPLFGLCFFTATWDGHLEIVARPEIGPDWRLGLRDLDTQLLDASRQRRGAAPRVFAVVKDWVDAELATFRFDLGPPVAEIKSLLAPFAGPGATPMTSALQAMRPVGAEVEPDAVKVTVAVDLPPAARALRAPEPALAPAQVRRWEAALQNWDGFVAFVVKDLGLANEDAAVRAELLELLLSARHDLLAVLGRGPEPGVDPVRGLFLSVWDRLRAIVRRAAREKGVEARALRYLVFLSAGDALAALETAAPAAGLEISGDGLRRLARALDPTHTGDPLEYSEQPDPKLRGLFRFRDPDDPPRPPRRKPSGSWLAPRAAYAAAVPDEWQGLGQRLDRWVPGEEDAGEYRVTVARLLALAADRSLDPDAIDERFDDLFRHLVKTVAWQESCWRQFVRRGGAVTYLASQTGDVGLMQINVRIWRGFFEPEKLRWSATYNAGAGAEILFHLLVRYGVREARERLDNAARATYSAYNGGPARLRRYRQAVPSVADRAFWEKYQTVAASRPDVAAPCFPRGSAGS